MTNYWLSEVNNCDFCKRPLVTRMVDGATHFGPWALMCPACFITNGIGVGLGSGQEYTKQTDGRWLKTKG